MRVFIYGKIPTMQGKQLARLVAAVIFIIYSNFFLSVIAADVPKVNNLRAPGTVKDYTLSSSEGVPPSLAPFLPMTSTDACSLYDQYVDALKGGDAVKILQKRDGFAYEHDLTDYSRLSCPQDNDGGWGGNISIGAKGCLAKDADAPEGCAAWRYAYFYGGQGVSKYRVTANRDCPSASPFEEYTVPVEQKSGLYCAQPLKCEYPFEPLIERDEQGYITKTECVTYCKSYQKFDEFFGRCVNKKEDVVDQSCPLEVLNPVNVKSGEKVQSFSSGIQLSGTFPIDLGINYGSQRDSRIRHKILQKLRESQSEQQQSDNWVKKVQPSNYKGPWFNRWLNLDYLDPEMPQGQKLWSTNYDMRLVTPTYGYYKGYVFIIENDHQYRKFKPTSRKYHPEVAENGDSLAKVASGWELTRNDLMYTFDLNGFLVKVTHPLGEYHLIARNGEGKIQKITHSNKEIATFVYSEDLLMQITVTNGNAITFSYDEKNNLVSYNTGNDKSRGFAYSDTDFEHALTNLFDSSGKQIGEWTYDSTGRAISVQNDSGKSGSIKYEHNKVIVEGEHSTQLVFNDDGTLIQSGGTSCGSSDNGVTNYDNTGKPISKTDLDGNRTLYKYDGWGMLSEKTEFVGTALEQTTKYRYNSPYKRLIETIYPNGTKVKKGYYTSGHLSGLLGYQRVISDGQTRQYTLAYNEQALVSSIDGFRSDVEDKQYLEYNAQKQLTKLSNSLGHTTIFAGYTAHGKPTQITDANATATELQYDQRGNITKIIQGERNSAFVYNAAGRLQTINQNGRVLTYSYDQKGRVTAVTDNAGNQIRRTLDENGNATKTDILGQAQAIKYTQSYVYDSLNRLTRTVSSNSDMWQYKYDTHGNLTEQIDPNNKSLLNQFDALNRTISSRDELNANTLFNYNNSNQLTQVTDALGRVTHYEYNGFGEVTKRISPDSGTMTYDYDSAGNMLWQRDARGVKTSYTYDALNRVTSITFPTASENIYFEYDDATPGRFGIGRLTKVTDSSGTQEYYYNQYGEVTQFNKSNSKGTHTSTTRYEYLNSGQLSAIVYPSGRRIEYTYNNLGQVTHVATRFNGAVQQLASNIQYLPFGPLSRLDYGNAKQLTQQFNQDYQLIDKQVTGVYNQKLSYDALTNINSIEDLLAPAQSQQYSYDLVSRLTNATGSYGELAFDYDAIGNRTNKTKDTVQSPYIYQNGKLQEVNGRLYEYDAAGNTVADGKGTYFYNAPGRLTKATILGVDYQYTYNYLGQRVVKKSGDTTRVYHYDLSGLVLAESDGAGNTLVEYVYLNGQRLALIVEQIYYVHANHIDAPLALTDQNGDIVWQASYTPFGVVNITTNLLSEEMTARFPGQYADSESGLYYNYFRDYDPELGRYIQSDPIGLAGGINTYGYVEGNPVNYVDPLGLYISSFDAYCMQNPSECVDILTDIVNIPNSLAKARNTCLSTGSLLSNFDAFARVGQKFYDLIQARKSLTNPNASLMNKFEHLQNLFNLNGVVNDQEFGGIIGDVANGSAFYLNPTTFNTISIILSLNERGKLGRN